jgi:hypothetical protein
MNLPTTLPTLLGLAWLLPLASFVFVLFFGKYVGKHGKGASYIASGAIIGAFVCSAISLCGWLGEHPLVSAHHSSGEHAVGQAFPPAGAKLDSADMNVSPTNSPFQLANFAS